jgi:WD and tetratricopeptide repeat-containing protein 1
LHLTHVTFSPNGDEVLLSYSGEHVYLMNVNYRLRRLVSLALFLLSVLFL